MSAVVAVDSAHDGLMLSTLAWQFQGFSATLQPCDEAIHAMICSSMLQRIAHSHCCHKTAARRC